MLSSLFRSLGSLVGRIWRAGCIGKIVVAAGAFVVFSLCAAPFLPSPPAATTTSASAVPSVAVSVAPSAEPSVAVVEVASPEPSRSAEGNAAGTTPARQAYFAQVSGPVTNIGQALQAMAPLFTDPSFGTDTWKINMAAQIASIRLAHEKLTAVREVPSELQPGHEALLDSTADCNEATNRLTTAIDNTSRDDLLAANELLRSCAEKIGKAQGLFQPYLPQ